MDASLQARAGDLPVRKATRYARYARLVSHPRAAVAIAALAFVMSLPAIAAGLCADDFDLGFAVLRDPLSAYAFQSRDAAARYAQLLAQRNAGTISWWADLDFHQAFFRPLASLSLALDFRLWPNAPWLMHIENGLVFALTILVAASFYKALGLSARVRGLATAFFAMQGTQSMSVGWISGRNTLLATLFGFVAIRLFVAARSGNARSHWFGLVSFVLALLSAEVGVSAIAYVIAYAVCVGDRTAPTPRSDTASARELVAPKLQLSALAPFALVIAVWLAYYKLNGYGVKNSGFYIDIAHSPGRFLSNLACAFPIYLASQLTAPYASFSVLMPSGGPVLAGFSLLILYVCRGLWLPWIREDSRARVLGVGALLSIVPLGSSPPQDRMVSFVALGVCGLIALIVEERLGPEPGRGQQKGARRLFFLHAVYAPLVYIPYLFGSMALVAGGGGVLLDRELGDDPRSVVLVNAPAFLPVHFFASRREWFGRSHPPIDLLYGGGAELELERTGEQTLQLTAASSGKSPMSLDRAPDRPLHTGEIITTERMRVEILELRDDAPVRLRFDFTEPLRDVRLYVWKGRRVELLPLPNIGTTTHVPAASAM